MREFSISSVLWVLEVHFFKTGYWRFIFFAQVSEQLWLFNGQVEDSTICCFFNPLKDTEHRSPPCLTTLDRELVSVLEVRIEPGDLNQRLLTPESIILPTIPLAGVVYSDTVYIKSITACYGGLL